MLAADYDGNRTLGGWSSVGHHGDRAFPGDGVDARPPAGLELTEPNPEWAGTRVGEWLDMHLGAARFGLATNGLGLVPDYVTVPINGRLAAALRAVEQWWEVFAVAEESVRFVLDHLWRWLAVTDETFDSWERERERSALLAHLVVDEQYVEVDQIAERTGVDRDHLYAILRSAVGLVHDQLYGRADHALSLTQLQTIAVGVGKSGIRLPPREQLPMGSIGAEGAWGLMPFADEVVRRRTY